MSLLESMSVPVEPGAARLRVPNPVVDRPLPGANGHLVADRRRAILRISDVGTFGIVDGRRVHFDAHPGVSPGRVSAWLHGTVAALLLAQRGRFALHASVVDIGGLGVAVSGGRGAGKSTTALRLTQSGHTLVTDDVSPLDVEAPVTVRPLARPLHVSRDTAASLGIDLSGARSIAPEHPKVAVPIAPSAPVAVRAIVVIFADDAETTVETAPVRGAQAHLLVNSNVYRLTLLAELWQTELFAWAGAVAASAAVHVLTRPATGWSVDAVADAVERIAAECTAGAEPGRRAPGPT